MRRALTLYCSYSYKLFCILRNLKPFAIKQIHTLSQKYPGWVVPRKNLLVESATYKLLSRYLFITSLTRPSA
jgi:hypothetical protein